MNQSHITVFDGLGAEGFELCHPDDERDFEVVRSKVSGMPQGPTWNPISVHLVKLDEGRKLRSSDAPWFGAHALAIGEKAIGAMGDLLTNNGELLPLSCGEAKLWLFNPTVLLDALDEHASTLMRFDDGRIMYIQRPVFRPELVRDVPVFKLATLPTARMYFGGAFVDRWQKAKLKGVWFRTVWSA